MNPDLRRIIRSKEAERRRLRALPWLEMLEMLDRWRKGHLSVPADAAASCESTPSFEVSAQRAGKVNLLQPRNCHATTRLRNDRVMDAVFKALADPSRRKLLAQLHANNGQTLSQLCEHLDMTRLAVTKHLLLLEEANLVATVWRGREKLHFLNPVPLHEICERWISKYERDRLQALSALKQGLDESKDK